MNKKWTITLVVLLLILNISSIGFMWWRIAPHRPDRRQEMKAAEFIVHELNLDARQRDTYLALMKAHRDEMRDADHDLMKAKDAFFDLLKEDKPDSNKVTAAAALIGKAEEHNNLLTLQHFQKLKAICNDEQKKKLETVLKGILGRMRNHPPPPPNGDRRDTDGPLPANDGNHPHPGGFENEPPEGPPPPPPGEEH